MSDWIYSGQWIKPEEIGPALFDGFAASVDMTAADKGESFQFVGFHIEGWNGDDRDPRAGKVFVSIVIKPGNGPSSAKDIERLWRSFSLNRP